MQKSCKRRFFEDITLIDSRWNPCGISLQAAQPNYYPLLPGVHGVHLTWPHLTQEMPHLVDFTWTPALNFIKSVFCYFYYVITPCFCEYFICRYEFSNYILLYYSNQFGKWCDLWHDCQNFEFGIQQNLLYLFFLADGWNFIKI